MNRYTVKLSMALLIGTAALSGCTINVYHASPSNPAMIDKSILVIPEADAKPTNTQSSKPESSIPLIPPLKSPSPGAQSIDATTSNMAMPNEVLSIIAKSSGAENGVHYMDSVGLEVQSMVDAYLNCFHKQADGAIVKVFPNRYFRRYWVYAKQELSLPDEKYFQFLANSAGATEGFMCLISNEDVLSKLPSVYQAHVFQKLPVENFDAVYALYRQATNENLVGRVVSYTIQQ